MKPYKCDRCDDYGAIEHDHHEGAYQTYCECPFGLSKKVEAGHRLNEDELEILSGVVT